MTNLKPTAFARVFFDNNHSGTSAVIYHNVANLTDDQMLSISTSDNYNASIFISFEHKLPKARIFNSSNEILWCGHGLLAVAHFLGSDPFLKRINTKLATIEVASNKDDVWIGFEQFEITEGLPCDLKPSKLFGAFDIQPCIVSYVGNSNGYVVLELPKGIDLSKLKVNFELLKAATRRAVIATQKADDGFDFKLRYFAPNHGVDEDVATGSANVILASYWSPKLNQTYFEAEQVSTQGAVIKSKIEKNKVWISGKVELYKE